ncbi:N-acetyl-alpha-D-glucosaminyl L-malate synthase BshA [Jeotgalicoccus coquinae]|uniref:GDP-mannose-dependent alpha-(1-6)-phosphatidylinositol monomannoside mannosyltransferase n=1 Tax=Jeotgalicoccus coquinae TaxID=709509 RepID=A0A6V7R7W0_9STAP|nr:N-acetyl-alpha-D-glucosaminyl L-malate synthase BshA [Jeotgalicoccus coquinae]MBB6422956.1 N-acetyl-alpha-D-glucosaminyl L-malate synthase BshA [Jeotgalicoccus coquinae]GGE11834.1 N-acetyl-alpha-D-glucosaminyl L-malate synthase BshA [Jeotgalicoccus coquinae]CAD2073577.1 GDP-mannose-dependent alpha-(1-6)-phosphatidylinositol monomannoside mannosyltransferase [Jeotgalicoccus coquinae]
MKIGITCYPSVGGSGVIATELGIQMARRGHEVHFISSSVPFRLEHNYDNIYTHRTEVNDYSVFKYPPYDITLSSKISEVIDRYDLDVIHMHYAIPHAVCGILAKQMSKKKDVGIVTTLHGTDITVLGHDMSLVSAIKFGIDHSDIATSVSNSLTEETYQLIKPESDIQTVYNFVDETRFNTDSRMDIKKELKEKLNIPDSAKVLMHTSNFRKIKNVDDIVRTFHETSKEIDCHLVLVGDGPDMYTIRQLVQELGIEERVHFSGQQSDVSSYYKLSDAFLLLSAKESFGLAMLEAMYCGAIPIGSTAGGISEVIQHGETGYVVEIGDYKQAAQHLIGLFKDDALYEEMQADMLKDVKERFNMDSIVTEYENLYTKLLAGADNDGTESI